MCRLIRIQLARRDTCERRKATPAEASLSRQRRWCSASPRPRLALRSPGSAALLLRLLFHEIWLIHRARVHIAALPFVHSRSRRRRLKRSPLLIDHVCRRKKWRVCRLVLLCITLHSALFCSISINLSQSRWTSNPLNYASNLYRKSIAICFCRIASRLIEKTS